MEELFGPQTITVMKNNDKKVILISDIHTQEFEFEIPKNACEKLAIKDKKIDYFIELNYDDISKPYNKTLYVYSRCITNNKKFFNPFLVDYRHKLPQRVLINNLITLFSLPQNELFNTGQLSEILFALNDNLKTIDGFNHIKLLKTYFDIVNKNNSVSIKPDKNILKYYVTEYKNIEKETGGLKYIFDNFYSEFNAFYDFVQNTDDKKVKIPVRLLLALNKLLRYLLRFEELLFDTYTLTGITTSTNDTVIVQVGLQHIKSYEKFLSSLDFSVTKKITF